MRSPMRRLTQAVLVFTVTAFFTFIFQNCAPYQVAESDGSLSSLATCTGSGCPQSPEAIVLSLGNSDPERLLRPSSTSAGDVAFDVGGFCDTAGYPANRITYTLTGPTPVGPIAIANACDELGRYRLLVQLPAGYNYSVAHTLTIELIVTDVDGRDLANPLGLNRREISVVSY